ncbi:MAG: hypothetical protein D3903_21200 [Candidatus Electrothrix sp. GM3_4]|nr:hypothetical protein [Candidatus Electrothrix sp. GM3_4]
MENISEIIKIDMQYFFLEKFKEESDNIRQYIKHISLTNKVGVENRDSSVRSLKEFTDHLHVFKTKKKIFEYKSIVISLYGVLESSICIWIQEHIKDIPSFVEDYNKLPGKLRENDFALSVNLITLINDNRSSKYDHLDKNSILTNLAHSINNPLKYSLNSDAFTPLSGNLKHSKIAEAFKAVDIELTAKLKSNKKFSEFLKSKYGSNIANKGNEMFAIIDDLVDRRNEIAHGDHVDNILNINEFEPILNFIEKYCEAVFSVIQAKEVQYEAEFLCRKLKNIKGVYKKGTVLCFEIEDIVIETHIERV